MSHHGGDLDLGQDQGDIGREQLSVPTDESAGLVRVRSSTDLDLVDTEENVRAQTEDIFLNYVYQSYINDTCRDNGPNDVPTAPEIVSFTTLPLSPSAEIGRHLARLGDDINERYAHVFEDMIQTLNIGEENAYENFAIIARRVFGSGINWGRIMILLSFGYRIALNLLRYHARHFVAFMTRVIQFMVRFIVGERITTWIASHGGWRAALNFIPGTSDTAFFLVSSMAVLSVLLVCAVHRYLH